MLAAREFIDNTRATSAENADRQFRVLDGQRKKEKRAKSAVLKTKTLVGVVVLFAILLAYTSMAASITRYGYQINSTKVAITAAENENCRLTLSVEELSSPERIETYAKTQLGMIPAEESRVLYKALPTVTTGAASAAVDGGMRGVAPAAANAKIEVLEGETMHPLLQGISDLVGQFKGGKYAAMLK